MEFGFLYFFSSSFCDDRPLVIKRAIRALMTRLINHVAFPLFFFSFEIFVTCAQELLQQKKNSSIY